AETGVAQLGIDVREPAPKAERAKVQVGAELADVVGRMDHRPSGGERLIAHEQEDVALEVEVLEADVDQSFRSHVVPIARVAAGDEARVRLSAIEDRRALTDARRDLELSVVPARGRAVERHPGEARVILASGADLEVLERAVSREAVELAVAEVK